MKRTSTTLVLRSAFHGLCHGLGDKPTSIRGGYQITYAGAGRLGNYSNYLFSNPGFVDQAITNGPLDGTYFSAQNLPSLVPVRADSRSDAAGSVDQDAARPSTLMSTI